MSSNNRSRTNLFLDIVIALVFLLAMTPRVTSIPVHEWMSIAFGVAVIIHLVLHWEWITGIGSRFFTHLRNEARLNFLIDLVFFVALVMIMVSGLAISKVALPTLGIKPAFSIVWKQVHRISAEVALIIVGVHCGMHLKWIVQNAKRYLIDSLRSIARGRVSTNQLSGGKK